MEPLLLRSAMLPLAALALMIGVVWMYRNRREIADTCPICGLLVVDAATFGASVFLFAAAVLCCGVTHFAEPYLTAKIILVTDTIEAGLAFVSLTVNLLCQRDVFRRLSTVRKVQERSLRSARSIEHARSAGAG